MILAVDAAHWWGPAGWAYRNLPGNVAADVLFGIAGYYAGVRKAWQRLHTKLDSHHNQQMDAHRATQERIQP